MRSKWEDRGRTKWEPEGRESILCSVPDRPKWLLAFTVMVLVFVLVFSRMWRNGNGTLRGEDIRNRRKGGGGRAEGEKEKENGSVKREMSYLSKMAENRPGMLWFNLA